MTRYQLLPPLSEDEYASLFDDIAAGGVKVPIDIDEDGEILDGHHRKRVCDELGIECPTRVVELPEAAKADYALTVNLARRHLDRMQRRQLVVNSLKLDYRLGDRVHARRCGVDHKTVTSIRSDLVAVGEIPHLTERQGADGKTYPAAKTPPALAEPENGKEGATEDGGPVAPSTPDIGLADAANVDESGEDRPAGEPGEAEIDHSAAGVTTPSAPTGPASSPEDAAPVESGQDGSGVSRPAPAPKEVEWSDDEVDLRKRLEVGETVVVSLRGMHDRLIRWAEEEDLFRRVDRKTDWGNPFELPADGDRTTVIANYAGYYLPHKPSLLSKLHALQGKALGCWCAPEACHGHVLARFAEAAGKGVLVEALDSVVSLATSAPDDFVALITATRGRNADH